MKYKIIEQTNDNGANAIEEYDTKDECIARFEELTSHNSFDPYYQDLVSCGGYLRMEDDNGNEIN